MITKYKYLLPSAGFENIVERKYAVPVNAWAPGKQSKAMGEINKSNLLASMGPLSVVILPRGLGVGNFGASRVYSSSQVTHSNSLLKSFESQYPIRHIRRRNKVPYLARQYSY